MGAYSISYGLSLHTVRWDDTTRLLGRIFSLFRCTRIIPRYGGLGHLETSWMSIVGLFLSASWHLLPTRRLAFEGSHYLAITPLIILIPVRDWLSLS